ncbi:MAG TPA: G1 family glutamic endopeptidase [Acidimicrobiales bacterium]|jgi:hypothetical protein
MRIRTTLGAAGIAALVGAATLIPSAQAAPAHAGLLPVRNATISGNWAGYVVPTSGVTSVTGSWTVPNAGTLPPGTSSTWTGIGGFSSQDLIQAGTQQLSPPFDSLITGGAYSAWYEMLPANPVYITGCSGDPNCTVTPGDAMTVTIANAGGSNWTISMADGAKWTYKIAVTYASTESSAEWIHEAPSLAGVLPIPVGNSGAVTFDGNNRFTAASVSGTIGQGPNVAVEALPIETTTSSLDTDTDGFNVCTYALTCAPPAT